MQQYELDTFGKSHDLLSNFWNSCFDDLMSTAEKKVKDKSDFKAKFQVSVQSIPIQSSPISSKMIHKMMCFVLNKKYRSEYHPVLTLAH